MAKDHVAKQKAAADEKEARERREREDRLKAEETRKAADTKGRTNTEWRQWVDKQKWMKKEIIEVIKADRATKTRLRAGMRLMTRNLGQVTNSKETILRVVNTPSLSV